MAGELVFLNFNIAQTFFHLCESEMGLLSSLLCFHAANSSEDREVFMFILGLDGTGHLFGF